MQSHLLPCLLPPATARILGLAWRIRQRGGCLPRAQSSRAAQFESRDSDSGTPSAPPDCPLGAESLARVLLLPLRWPLPDLRYDKQSYHCSRLSRKSLRETGYLAIYGQEWECARALTASVRKPLASAPRHQRKALRMADRIHRQVHIENGPIEMVRGCHSTFTSSPTAALANHGKSEN